MIGLWIAIIFFNFIAFKTNKRLTSNQIVHIWAFTVAFQFLFDWIVEIKYCAYWYFDKGVDWKGIPSHTVLIAPVNMMLLNNFPFNSRFSKQAVTIACWTIGVIMYEAIALLPKPFGYFHLGWWRLWYDLLIVPILILILLGYYKWICKLERKAAIHINKREFRK
ncbi:hypothetical protein HPT25_17385 [Bacillus sp. BRMEA1]|uniref:hypothetical protein n=1 Tax=Neobacillus endophyticus TaxID=2738405 RepID=UPI00156610B1|nr:hypothetical protein [Neobacillus endophyticus]NRD79134.1 hypothetical protein [Neobacillus endophyticus]